MIQIINFIVREECFTDIVVDETSFIIASVLSNGYSIGRTKAVIRAALYAV